MLLQGWTERSHSKKEAGMTEPWCLHPPWKCDNPTQPRRPNSRWTGMGGKYNNIRHTVWTCYLLIQCFGHVKKFLLWKWLIGCMHLVQISLPRTVMQWFTACMNASIEAVFIFKSYMHVCVCVFFKHNLFMDMKIFLFFLCCVPFEVWREKCLWTCIGSLFVDSKGSYLIVYYQIFIPQSPLVIAALHFFT